MMEAVTLVADMVTMTDDDGRWVTDWMQGECGDEVALKRGGRVAEMVETWNALGGGMKLELWEAVTDAAYGVVGDLSLQQRGFVMEVVKEVQAVLPLRRDLASMEPVAQP